MIVRALYIFTVIAGGWALMPPVAHATVLDEGTTGIRLSVLPHYLWLGIPESGVALLRFAELALEEKAVPVDGGFFRQGVDRTGPQGGFAAAVCSVRLAALPAQALHHLYCVLQI